MVAAFEAAGALSRERAKTLEDLGLHRGVILRRLRERAVVREAAPGHYYVDEESWAAVRRMRRRAVSVLGLVALVLLFIGIFFSRSARAEQARPEIDAIFATWDKKTTPGCALGIFQDGKIVYERGYGMADLENDIPITPGTVFYVGSMSKQFTAAAVALAIQQGKLSAGDSIRKWIPELPAYADAITIRHLVHHTSGLRDFHSLNAIAGRRADAAFDNDTILRMTVRQKALNFEPGTELLYSNTGYQMLPIAVERATKTRFVDYVDQQIFTPLGMTITHFHTDLGRLVKRRADAYSMGQDGSVRLDTPVNVRAGAGGVYTSIRDLLHWDENFYSGRVGGKAFIEQLETPGRLNNGDERAYAWGLQLSVYRGLKIVEHGGSLGGYRAHLMRFRDRHTSIAVLCNVAITPNLLARRVADVVLFTPLTTPTTPTPTTVTSQGPATPPRVDGRMDATVYPTYVGKYASDEIDSTFTIALNGDRLTLLRDTDASPAALVPIGPHTFRVRGFVIRFEREGSLTPSLVVDAGRVRDIRFVRQPLR